MTALNFPDSPTLNQVFDSTDGRSWTWTGSTWDAVLTEAPAGPQGPQGPAGANGANGAPGPAGEANFNSFLLLGA